MFNLDNWLITIEEKIKAEFGKKVLFIGYQGSYRRGEATEKSDIDMVVVLDSLGLQELEKYQKIVQSMDNQEKACGFISGKEEIRNWSKFELFQLYNDTAPLYGDLKELIPELTKEDAREAEKNGAQSIFHMACHSFLYGTEKRQSLSELYKSIFFVLQARFFFRSGMYILTKSELIKHLVQEEKEILDVSMNREKIEDYSDEEVKEKFSLIIEFCSEIIKKYKQD